MGADPVTLGAAAAGGGLATKGIFSWLGSDAQEDAAKEAARQQEEYYKKAIAAQNKLYGKAIGYTESRYKDGRGYLAPWRQAGERSLANLERMHGVYEQAVMDPSKYKESPGYQWLYEQGVKGLQSGAAASGKLDSGQNLKDLVNYGQGTALQDYQGYLGRLQSVIANYSGLSNTGYSAAGQTAGLGMQSAGMIGNLYSNQAGGLANLYTGMGGAQAEGLYNAANARASLYNTLGNIGMQAGMSGGSLLAGGGGGGMGAGGGSGTIGGASSSSGYNLGNWGSQLQAPNF